MAVTQLHRSTQIKAGSNWRLVINNGSGLMSDASAITADRALVSDSNGIPVHSAVTATELGHVSGVTSAIQTQLNGKASTALSNLASVAINTSLVSDTNNTDDLGTDAIEWKDLWAHAIKHNDTTNPNLLITTTGNNGDINITPHGSGNVFLNSDVQVEGNVILNGYAFSVNSAGTKYLGDNAGTIELVNEAGGSVTVAADTDIILNPTNQIDASNKRMKNLADPAFAQDAATKSYVDSVAAGLDPKASVRAATTAALPAVTYNNGTGGVGATLTANANGALPAQDGVTLSVGQRLLVKNQAAALQNGIYTVTVVGDGSTAFVLTRATDQDGSPSHEVSGGNFTFVEAGTTLSDTGWVVSADGNIVVGTDPVDWVQFSSEGAIVAGAGLTKTGNTIDVNAADASIQVNADDIQVRRDGAGAIGLSGSGIAVNVGTGIEISSNALRISSAAAGDGLGYSAGVLSVNVAASGGLEISSDNVQIKTDTATANTIGVTTTSNGAGVKFDSNSFVDSGSETLALAAGVAGNGLSLTSGVLAINVDDTTIELSGDALRVKDLGISYAKTRLVTREVPSGTINGTNDTFTLAFTPAAGSEHVYRNGILQNVGGSNDYTITGATITFNAGAIPQSGDTLLVSYWRA